MDRFRMVGQRDVFGRWLVRVQPVRMRVVDAKQFEIVERILAEVSDFANGEPQHDDMTLVVMKVQEGCEI